jgi:cell division protein FtsW
VVFSALAVTCVLLIAVFFLDRSHGTHRWIAFGNMRLGQPSELAKPALILFLAYFLEGRMRHMGDFRGTLLPAFVPPMLFAALIAKQPDLGTALACLAISGTVFFVAGMQLRRRPAPRSCTGCSSTSPGATSAS